MEQELNDYDITLLKKEKRVGYTFLLIFIGLGFVPTVFFFFSDVKSLLLLSVSLFCLGYFICFLINRKINKDLKNNAKTVIVRKLEQKITEKAYEAGSANINFANWLFLFPSQLKMRESIKYILIVNGFRYEVSKEIFDIYSPGDPVCIFFAKNSYTLLGFSTVPN